MKLHEQPAFYWNHSITSEQIGYFNRYGIIQFKNFINKETVASFLNEINKVQRFLLDNNIDKVNGIPLKFGSDINGDKIVQRIAFTSKYSAVLSNFLKSDKIQSVIKLLGD